MSKHMSIEDRQTISEQIRQGQSLSSIAKQIGKSQTTVAREVRKHRVVWDKPPYGRLANRCVKRHECIVRNACKDGCKQRCSTCKQCNSHCPIYEEEHCAKLNQPPYVCESCPNLNRCPLEKFRYDPFQAHQKYRETLVESRTGYNLTPDQIQLIDSQVTPLILQGQSVYHATIVCGNTLPVSGRTIYRLIDKCSLKARNIDLPRKSKLKPRKGVRKSHKIDPKCRLGRTYEDFLKFIEEHPDVMPVQMDSVVGGAGTNKVLLTLRFKGDFMPVFIRDRNTAATVLEWIEFLYDGLGHDDFCAFFPVILTDNGSEFSNPAAIETAPDGRSRTKVFYCEPMASWQKPNVERCHELFRRILPSGSSLDSFSQQDMIVAASHVNSYARQSLGGKTPMDSLAFYYGEERAGKLLRLLCQVRITAKDIVLSPDLLTR